MALIHFTPFLFVAVAKQAAAGAAAAAAAAAGQLVRPFAFPPTQPSFPPIASQRPQRKIFV